MNPLTCAEVQTQLDLYAAGACDPPTAAALARHLATCRECGRAHREAQHLQALLDIRFRESEGIERIRSRVQTAPRRTLRGVRTLPFLRRALAVAAMLLIAISLPALLGPLDQTNGRPVATVLWASPESQYASRSPGTFELAQGELWVRVHPGAKQSSRPGNVTVQTPGGVATVQGTEFFIAADKNRVLVTVRDGRVKLTNPRGDAEARPGEVLQGGPAEAPRREVEALSLRFGRQYRPEPVKASPRLLAQKPPFNLSKAVDYKRVAAAFPLEKVMAALERDGFVVLPGSGQDTLGAAYQALRAHDVPVVVTADAVLHLCRAQFAETLRDLEERIFVPELTGLLRALVDALDRLPPGGSEEARTLAMGYLAVALRVLEPDAPLPQAVDAAAVGEVVAAIRRHERGPVRVRLLGRNEDFGAYRPEGHYRQSERLQRYHAA
ncbi:MAG TPA: DUF3160 domain-containing protein, partial [Gemmataceae bacterium]|nr:DUF3160 domain-containing protein [Gemmataceae bacterium]